MTIAKGRTNLESVRDLTVQKFKNLLSVLKQAKCNAEESVKASLYDILTDKSIPQEEQSSITSPFYDLLSTQEKIDIGIRGIVLIGVFSFWEQSLKDICLNYFKTISTYKSNSHNKGNSKKKQVKYTDKDYLYTIFNHDLSKDALIISTQIKELRNYITHGTITENRQHVIDKLLSERPDFCISKTQKSSYEITSYEGVERILDTIKDTLNYAEKTARLKSRQTY